LISVIASSVIIS